MWDTSRTEFSARQLLEVATTHGLEKVGLSLLVIVFSTRLLANRFVKVHFGPIWPISLAAAFCGVERTGVGARTVPEPSNTHTVGKALCTLLP